MVIRDIPGYEGLYSITDDGQVYSIKRKIYMKQQADKDGYLCVNLRKDGRYRRFFIHRLVALTYVENPEGKETVNHINEIKTDNRAENLEWATRKEQTNHGTRTERAAASESIPVRCIDTGVVYPSAKAAADAYDTSGSCITKVCKGKARTHRNLHWEYFKEEKK